MAVKLGLIGENIGYTLSPIVHSVIFEHLGIEGTFRVYDCARGDFEKTFRKMTEELDGFNVTKPYKTDAAASVDEDRSGYGSVNTVKAGEKTIGYNTDGYGFMRSFNEHLPKDAEKKVLILGAGGAARTAVACLKGNGYEVYIHNRSKWRLDALIKLEGGKAYDGEQAPIVVNCTTCGYKDGEDPAASLDLKGVRYAFDLIYNPEKTAFLKRFESTGAEICNGLDMLIYQAVASDGIILGREFDERDHAEIKKAARERIAAR